LIKSRTTTRGHPDQVYWAGDRITPSPRRQATAWLYRNRTETPGRFRNVPASSGARRPEIRAGHCLHTAGVTGSIPVTPTIFSGPFAPTLIRFVQKPYRNSRVSVRLNLRRLRLPVRVVVAIDGFQCLHRHAQGARRLPQIDAGL